jgi:DNA polymerase (family 10)
MGLRVNEYGVYREPSGERLGGEQEQDIFTAVGLPYIEPELRENRGEIEAAEAGQLPRLITEEDIRGDLHMHTDASDGISDARTMAEAAIALGREYIAITEHSKGLAFAGGIDAESIVAQTKELRRLQDKLGGIRLLSGIEVDILRDGELDIDDDTLASLDWVIASVHSGFGMDGDKMTQRMIRAMETGLVDCIGHPTGRLLGERDPYAVDMDALLAAAARLGVFMELNAHPTRLDLGATHCRQARDLGVKVAINTDAHDADQLDGMEYGIYTARRGWLAVDDVLNAQPVSTLEEMRRQRLRARSTARSS